MLNLSILKFFFGHRRLLSIENNLKDRQTLLRNIQKVISPGSVSNLAMVVSYLNGSHCENNTWHHMPRKLSAYWSYFSYQSCLFVWIMPMLIWWLLHLSCIILHFFVMSVHNLSTFDEHSQFLQYTQALLSIFFAFVMLKHVSSPLIRLLLSYEMSYINKFDLTLRWKDGTSTPMINNSLVLAAEPTIFHYSTSARAYYLAYRKITFTIKVNHALCW